MSVNIMIRYGELSTKGKNKKSFVQQLAANVKHALVQFPKVKIQADRDYMTVVLNGESVEGVSQALSHVFGIQSYAPVYRVNQSLEEMGEKIIQLLSVMDLTDRTFKIAAKRSDHTFHLDTQALNAHMGAVVLSAYPQLTVDVKNPDILIKVEVRQEGVYLSTQVYKGAGGLPVGTGGRGMMMLSGGIDSPVASYLALKRGLSIEMVHFYSPPYTSPQSLRKTQELTKKLAKYAGPIQFIEVPFTTIQEEIKAKCPQAYAMTLNRRMMLRITDKLREKRKGLIILNGESMGQVASQTLHSMVAINEVTNTPIVRPVAAMDKLDIIKIAEEIDTFTLSIQPFEDCCTIFAPTSPKTRPNLEKVHEYEQRIAVDALVLEAVERAKIYEIDVTTTFEDNIQHIESLF